MQTWFQGRITGWLALAVPVLAGLAYLLLFRAPLSMVAINAGALVTASIWIAFGKAPIGPATTRIVILVLLAVLFLPLVTGPDIEGVSRWIPLGLFTLHAGTLALPALVVVAANDNSYAPLILLAALLAIGLQPDAASGLAISCAAGGLYAANRDWRIGLISIVGFCASIAMALHGELPPQPFVERVVIDAAQNMPLIALGLIIALAAGLLLMLFSAPLTRRQRFALGGSLFGFSTAAILSSYPSVLIGYGAAPILGYGLALGLRKRDDDISKADQ